jgi:hypothetical protein
MRQIEPHPNSVNRLMMGPDGAVHVIPAGIRNASAPGETEGRAVAAQQADSSGSVDPPAGVAKRAEVLRDMRRMPGDGSICFSYSAVMPPSDRDAARRALRDVRRVPEGGVCFSY